MVPYIFPKIAVLVDPGGDFEGYLPIFQGDNAGPHICAIFHNCMKEYCAAMGWKWESQAPQMPYIKNLDLAVFPAMLKRHSALIKAYSKKMAPADEIWKACESVWRELDSVSIA